MMKIKLQVPMMMMMMMLMVMMMIDCSLDGEDDAGTRGGEHSR